MPHVAFDIDLHAGRVAGVIHSVSSLSEAIILV
jgi:hypothetical protein